MVKDEERPKLSRLEVLGAWLHVWTPPRDARVPPIPWRRIGVVTLAGLFVLGAAASIIGPAIDDAKDDRATRERREVALRAEARRERIRVEQQPRFGDLRAADNRTEQLAAIETAIGADARERFSPRARPATCEPAPGEDVAARRLAYACLSAIRDIVGAGEQEGARGQLGIPYRAVVDFEALEYAFCKVNPPPGEQVIPDPRRIVELPPECLR